MENALRRYVSRLQCSIPETEWAWFVSRWTAQTLSSNDYWVRSGEQADSIGFCTQGLFRFFYVTEDGDELNKSFCGGGDFVAAFSSLIRRQPASLSIQALVDSEVWVLSYEELEALYDRHVCWERFGRRLAENLFIKKESRERELLLCTAEERYRLFLQEYPQLHQAIPQYHVASYLGITPVALSRIRRRMNRG